MSSIGTVFTYPNNPRVARAQIAGAYSGATVNTKEFNLQTDRTPEFMKKFPMGKIPALAGDKVDLFESAAIGFYAAAQQANSPLIGQNPVDQALILQWTLFAENEISTPSGQWVYPLLGYRTYLKPSVDAGIEALKRSLKALNDVLLTKTYLVGEDITLADINVVTALVLPFTTVCDKEFRSQYKNVVRYFNTCVNKPQFKQALGEVKLCETPLKYTPPKKEKKEAPKKETPKKEAKPAAAAPEEPKPEPKPKSALDALPPSPLKLDEWKRMYSNNDTDVAMKWFWEHFDSEGYSIWRCDYKYNDELTLVFMSNNLIGGFYARLERARKYAFGSMIVCGENNNNTISGYWIIRGQEVPYEIYDAADFPSYEFKKIEPSQYAEKKDEIEKYMAWEVEGFADGKIFK